MFEFVRFWFSLFDCYPNTSQSASVISAMAGSAGIATLRPHSSTAYDHS